MKIELVMSEFGNLRANSGGATFSSENRFDPTLSSFLKIFPDALVSIYTDFEIKTPSLSANIKIIRVQPPFDKLNNRYGWRSHDYFQAIGLLNSNADVAIAMDADMLIVSNGFKIICNIVSKFGLAVPLNPRLLQKVDGSLGLDSDWHVEDDEFGGLGISYNLTPIAFNTSHNLARRLLEEYSISLYSKPSRGSLHLTKASQKLGYQPYILPFQWCVCTPKDLDSKHVWNNAIALHVGHSDVLSIWKRKRFLKNLKRYFVKSDLF